MDPRLLVALLSANGALAGEATSPAPEAPPVPAPRKEASPVTNAIQGTWIYAKDPTRAIAHDKIYVGSTITFEAGGGYTFALADARIPLTGTWELRGEEGDTVRVHTEYGRERRNDLTLTLRRDRQGKVIGMEVREGDDDTGARFYVPHQT
jgi:hypothetical protein